MCTVLIKGKIISGRGIFFTKLDILFCEYCTPNSWWPITSRNMLWKHKEFAAFLPVVCFFSVWRLKLARHKHNAITTPKWISVFIEAMLIIYIVNDVERLLLYIRKVSEWRSVAISIYT
jgi:hypothetical protein